MIFIGVIAGLASLLIILGGIISWKHFLIKKVQKNKYKEAPQF